MFDYYEKSRLAAETLDKYDLTDVLKEIRGLDVAEVRNILCHFNKEVAETVWELSLDELAIYLSKIYSMYVEEVTIPYLWWIDRRERT